MRRAFNESLEQRTRAGEGQGVFHDGRVGRTAWLDGWKPSFAGEDVTAALEPVLGKDGLTRCHDRSFDAHHRVAPRRLSAVAGLPAVGDAGAAGKSHPTVD